MADQFKELHPELHNGPHKSGASAQTQSQFASLTPVAQASSAKQWVKLDPFSQQWLEETLKQLGIQAPFKTEALTGDASSRRYVRVHCERRSFILCLSEDYFSNQRFREVSAQLHTVGVMAPLVFAYHETPGLMLLSDLGTTQLADLYHMNPDHLPRAIIHRALNDLSRLAMLPDGAFPSLGHYDQALLDRDFGLFTEWALSHWLQLELNDAQQNTLQQMANVLAEAFRLQPQVWVHRDFHCRNLMVTDDDIAMIDFQDMVRGPVTYDLASLVNDAYWLMSPEQQHQVVEDYYHVLLASDLRERLGPLPSFRIWHGLTALQRLIKIIGIFCRLSLRDGKTGYMKDLPMVLEHIERQWLYFEHLLNEQAHDNTGQQGVDELRPLVANIQPFIMLWRDVLRPAMTQKLDPYLSS